LNNYPPRLAKLKQLRLHTLTIFGVDEPEAVCRLARWLLEADSLFLLESLSWLPFDESTSDVDGCITDMMATAGASLKRLRLDSFQGDPSTLNFRSNTSLQSIHLHWLSANAIRFALSTVSSQEMSTVKLQIIEADRIEDVDALAALLVSDQFASLPSKLNHLSIEILPTGKWHDRLAGTTEQRYRGVIAEMDGPFSKLQRVFGERVEAGIYWLLFKEQSQFLLSLNS